MTGTNAKHGLRCKACKMSIHHKCMDGLAPQRCMGKLVRACALSEHQNPLHSHLHAPVRSLYSHSFTVTLLRIEHQEGSPRIPGLPAWLRSWQSDRTEEEFCQPKRWMFHTEKGFCVLNGVTNLSQIGAFSVLTWEVPHLRTVQVLKVKAKHPRTHTPSPRQTRVVGHPHT